MLEDTENSIEFRSKMNKFKQTVAVFFYLTFFLVAGPLSLTSLIYILVCSSYWWVGALYATWWLWDFQICNQGGRKGWIVQLTRRCRIWKWFGEYFPIKLVATAPLDPKFNYLICHHPHGILCFGASCCYASEGCNFSSLFPGITPHLTTIEGNLWMPLFREYFLCFGAVSSSKKSLNFLLSQPGGSAPVLLIGGVPEMQNSVEGEVKLVLKKRKGFVKLALKHGACLVPSFSFGEADLYQQTNKVGLLHKFLKLFRNTFGISPVIFSGCGALQNYFGILPKKKPLTVVVGEPLLVEKNENPTNEEINSLHALYVTELKKLYKKYNPVYGDCQTKLVIS